MEEHVPEIMSTGLFEEFKFFRLLEQDDSEGLTFIFKYYIPESKNNDDI